LFCVGGRPKEMAGGAWIRTYEYKKFILQNLSSPDCADLSWRVRKDRVKKGVRQMQGAHHTGNRHGFFIG
jgi:hypothetical protein